MSTQLDALTQKLREIEQDIEAELTRRREALRFHFERKKIVFEHYIEALQRAIRVKA